MAKKNAAVVTADEDGSDRRAVLSQTDVPRHSLRDAIRVAQAIADNYAKRPTKPLRIAEAIGIAPTTGSFRTITSASAAYGITTGTAWATEIALTDLGRRIVAPTEEGDEVKAKREAFLRPRVIRLFMEKYDGSRIPSEQIAMNVLDELGVPVGATKRAFDLIRQGAQDLGMIRSIKGQDYVDLQGVMEGSSAPPELGERSEKLEERVGRTTQGPSKAKDIVTSMPLQENRRVFITHGQNREIANQMKELLTFGNFDPVMSVEKETGAKPVPDKVMDDMRSCAAAVVHVGSELKAIDPEGKELAMLNSNVLIEIGAAMALYGRRFILLVEKGVTLPSNLVGLYEVRYEGSRLDYEATMKLLKAFNDFRQ